jgi:hypothetical protein
VLLHIGGASTAGVIVAVAVIFLMIFAMSFAFGAVPEGKRRFSRDWMVAWIRASLPRLVVAAAFSAAIGAGAIVGGDSSNGAAADCGRPLAPYTGNPVTPSRLLGAIAGMQNIADAAREGDISRAQTIFYTQDAHALTHDIDPILRDAAPDLGRRLCEQVIALENEMTGTPDATAVAVRADSIAAILQEAQPYVSVQTRPPVTSGGVCDSPVAPVGGALTAARLETAIADMRETARLAATGDQAAAEAAFSGEAHNITHDLDGPLRRENEELAIELCLSIIEIERSFGTAYDAALVQREAEKSAGLLEDAGRALGIIE